MVGPWNLPFQHAPYVLSFILLGVEKFSHHTHSQVTSSLLKAFCHLPVVYKISLVSQFYRLLLWPYEY